MDDLITPSLGRAPDPQAVRDQVAAWVTSQAFVRTLSVFDGPIPKSGNVEDLETLVAWASTHWDFRSGRERNLVDPDMIGSDIEDIVVACARDLGLVDARPPQSARYDHVLVLGGLVRACVWRLEYAAYLLSHGISASSMAAITGYRSISADEQALLPALGLPRLGNEVQVVEAALQRCFPRLALSTTQKSASDAQENARYQVTTGTAPDGLEIRFLVAPSAEPEMRRANTADGYRFWAEQIAHVAPGTHVLLVTSQIYVPFQQADAVRILGLPYGCVVETVGIDHNHVDTCGIPQMFRAVHYLQEMNSALRSFRMLLSAVGDV